MVTGLITHSLQTAFWSHFPHSLSCVSWNHPLNKLFALDFDQILGEHKSGNRPWPTCLLRFVLSKISSKGWVRWKLNFLWSALWLMSSLSSNWVSVIHFCISSNLTHPLPGAESIGVNMTFSSCSVRQGVH